MVVEVGLAPTLFPNGDGFTGRCLRYSTSLNQNRVLLEKRFGTHRPRQSLAGGAKSSTMLSSMARLLLLSYIVMCCWQSLNISNDLIFCQYSMKWQMIRSNPPNLLIREQYESLINELALFG